MDVEHRSDDQDAKEPGVKESIKKLKAKLIPGLKYTFIISAAINFSMLVVGCLNVHKCPVNKNIPLFLIAVGAIGLTSKFVSYVRTVKLVTSVQLAYFESSLYSVETIFFFLGTYWVYKEFQPSYDPLAGYKYCNKTAYLFGFIYLTVTYIIVIVAILGFLCFLGCAIWLAKMACNACSYDVESQPANAEATETLTPKNQSEVKP